MNIPAARCVLILWCGFLAGITIIISQCSPKPDELSEYQQLERSAQYRSIVLREQAYDARFENILETQPIIAK
jgi:hypothetical protein